MIVWRCDPGLLRPAFRADVEAFLQGSPFTWYALSGFRSLEDQAALFAKYQNGGPRAAPPGSSAHNYGLAIDVVLDTDPETPGLQPSWNTKLAGWLWLKAATTAHPRLAGGWRFHDWPHIERYQWRQYINQEG